MRKVEFFDTSLRDGEQTPGVNFSIKEKVAIAKQLEKWGISVIEAGFPAASPDSFEAVKQIAEAMTTTSVTGLARSVKSDIDACYEALKDAKYPQIHVFIATSPIHREFKLKKSKEEILEAVKAVSYTHLDVYKRQYWTCNRSSVFITQYPCHHGVERLSVEYDC